MTIDVVGNKCCGCRTCEISCPKDAITVGRDRLAFEMPAIDKEKCIDCGKCIRVCPVLNKEKVEYVNHLLSGAAYALDPADRSKGSSGGLFGLLAKAVLKKDGVVYGAAFNDDHQLLTAKACTEKELEPLYKSKYLLCNTNGEFKNIKADLEAGRNVLYCSSPCQIAALKLYLNKDYDNLCLVEFVCHGVGSQEMFDKSIAFTEKKLNAKIKRLTMRHKTNSASFHWYKILYEKDGRDKEKVGIHLTFPYYNAYGKRLVCRESCFDCKFASPNRVADLTIADFHSIEKYEPSLNRFSGVSMFVCNSEKGRSMFEDIREVLWVKEMPWDIICKNNRFNNDEKKPSAWDDFLNLSVIDYDKAYRKYLNPYKDWRYYYYKCPEIIREIGLKIFKV